MSEANNVTIQSCKSPNELLFCTFKIAYVLFFKNGAKVRIYLRSKKCSKLKI